MVRAALLASSALLMVGMLPAAAQDATWLADPGSGDFNAAANWNPEAVPTGTAFFGTSNTTDLFFSADTTIGGLTFNPGADTFSFSNGDRTVNINGAGIVSNGGIAGILNAGVLNFLNNSTAGSFFITNDRTLNFNDSSTAGKATITNVGGAVGNTVNFNDSSTAGEATINNVGGTVNFNDSSSAGVATINNNDDLNFNDTSSAGVAGATINNNADLNFNDTSTAGGATINNNNNGGIDFRNSSTAGSATINNNRGVVQFFGTSSADDATITNDDGLRFNGASSAGSATATITNNLNLSFVGSSSAGSATITNNSGGFTEFLDASSASNATIINDDALEFNDTSTAGSATIINNMNLAFFTSSSAGSANITNNNSDLQFFNTSTAASATITNNSQLFFNDKSSAASATITNEDAVRFQNGSSAGNATIINNANNSLLAFFDNSTADQAQIVTHVGAVTDFSATTGPLGNNQLTAGSFAGAGAYFLGANTLTVGGNGLSTEVSGVISDCGPSGNDCQAPGATGGSLVKTGGGVFTLSGPNSYTGATTVDAGTLLVNGSIASSSGLTVEPGATVGGTGILPSIIVDGGTLSPGNSIGTMNVAGDLLLTSAATYLVEIAGTNADRTNVTGTADLAGTVQAVFRPGRYVTRSYTILSAAGGRNGTFDALTTTNLPAFVTAALSYTSTDVLLNLALRLGRVNGLTGNHQAVGSAIDNAFNAGVPLTGKFVNFLNLTPATLPGVLDQLSGEVATSTQSAAFRSMDLFLQMMLDPFALGRSNYAGGPALAFSVKGAPGSALVQKFPIKEPPPPPTFEQRWTAWGGAYGGRESRDGDPGIGSHETRTNVWGLAAGADWRLQDSVMGVALSAGTTSFDLSEGLGDGNTEFMQVGLYGSTRMGAAYASAALAYGWHQAEHTRTIAFAGPDTLKGEFDAHQFGGRIEAGWRHATPWLSLTPYAALTAQQFNIPSYAETASAGSADFALDYAGRTADSVRSEIGAWLDQVYMLDYGGILTLRGRVAWLRDYSDDPVMNAAFPVLPGSGFSVIGATAARDALLASAASELELADGLSFIAKFDGEFAENAQAYSGTATLRRVW